MLHLGIGLHGVVSPMIVLNDCGTRLSAMPTWREVRLVDRHFLRKAVTPVA